jgi:16S rRNA (guanine527-N7)-methyltransferase
LPESATDLPELDPLFWSVIDDGLRAGGLGLDASQRTAIDRHIRLLVVWNSAINLTALRTPEQMARNHVLDSVIFAPVVRELAGERVTMLDIGTGAGFPGIALAVLLRPARAALVESVGKKARFLEVASRAVGEALTQTGDASSVQLDVLPERAEDLADEADHRETWDVVVARAVGSMAEVAELGLPLARVGGHVVAWKSDAGDGALQCEIAASRRVTQAAGGGAARVIRVPAVAAVGLAGHCLVVIRKTGRTPDRYPRQPAERRQPGRRPA